ncbi:MAG: excinuclease ABC subunit UvrC [Xanthobacteraceae bacterium]
MPDDKKNLEPDLDLDIDPADDEPSLPALDDETSAPPPIADGPAAIARYARIAPPAPGVYRMMDARGEVLYVGKAKNIRKRILAYQRAGGHTMRIARMIAATASIEFVSTATETEALLLEANLIKRLRPRFNVLLRDDKSFPYILITGDHPAPQIAKHRGARNRPGRYFGPFASAMAVHRTITALERAFLIRSCSDAVYESRTRPCLLHQIKRCSAPCTGEIAVADYAELVQEATAFLSGKSRQVKEELAAEMEKAANVLDFERAAVYRDRLAALSAVQAHQGINPRGVEEADVFAAHQDGGFTCVQVFFFRTGQNWGNRAYFPRADRSLPAEAVLGAFIGQFYDDKPCPRLVLVSHDIDERALIAEALTVKSGYKVEVLVPQRGEKKDLVDHALANAREALGRKLAETSSQHRLLVALAATFGLGGPPRRIEVFDNSHIQGSNAVGAMVVAGPEGFRKNQYRKFNIRSTDLTPGDDYAMMREMLTRRFRRLLNEAPRGDGGAGSAPAEAVAADGPAAAGFGEAQTPTAEPPAAVATAAVVEDPRLAASAEPPQAAGGTDLTGTDLTGTDLTRTDLAGTDLAGTDLAGTELAGTDVAGTDLAEDDAPESPWPDLVLIDGGLGQLNAARDTLAALGVTDVPLVAIAKGPDRDAGRETFFVPGRTPFMLKPRDPVLYFVERLRDEAHRFAIGSHRQKRKRDIREAGLQEIPGIGPARKRALLRHFGTLRAIERASMADLEHVAGINAETARKVYDFFHEAPR